MLVDTRKRNISSNYVFSKWQADTDHLIWSTVPTEVYDKTGDIILHGIVSSIWRGNSSMQYIKGALC